MRWWRWVTGSIFSQRYLLGSIPITASFLNSSYVSRSPPGGPNPLQINKTDLGIPFAVLQDLEYSKYI
jgi:hypothetical protein